MRYRAARGSRSMRSPTSARDVAALRPTSEPLRAADVLRNDIFCLVEGRDKNHTLARSASVAFDCAHLASKPSIHCESSRRTVLVRASVRLAISDAYKITA